MKQFYLPLMRTMKINTLLGLLFYGLCNTVQAQVNYSFSAATSIYVPVSGGTTPVLIARPWGQSNEPSITYDEGIANNLPIGFTFNYNGIDYTTINICANGFATLGTPFIENLIYTQSFYSNSLKFGLLSYAFSDSTEPNAKPILAPLWDDLNCQADANLRYITTGPAGSRVFTFEWSGVKWQYNAAGTTISFQLKLYEGSNVVAFCYKDEGGAPFNASASIGITASNKTGGGFLSLQNTSASPDVSTTTENKELSLKPANNQEYRFTPLPCRLPLNLKYSSSNTSVSFSWDAPAGVNFFEYVVDAFPGDPVSGTVVAGTNQTISSLPQGTNYYIHLRSYCSEASKSVWLTRKVSTMMNISPAPPIAWQKNLGGSGFDMISIVKQTPDGGYIVGATSSSNNVDVTGNHGNQDYWIVKLSSTGAIMWKKCLGGNDYEQLSSLALTADGGYIVIGYTESNMSGYKGSGDCWMIKLNISGDIDWQKFLGGGSVDMGTSVEQTNDGGYIVSGATLSNNGDVSGNHDPLGIQPDIWIVKLNSSGIIQWQKCLGGTEDEFGIVKPTSDGGSIMLGTTNSTDGDLSGIDCRGEIWIVKLNDSGVMQWQKCLGGSGYDYPGSIEQTPDGGYILSGSIFSSHVNGEPGSDNFWVLKLNSTGNITWQKTFGGSGHDAAYSIKITSDGGYIVSGSTLSDNGDVTGNHGGVDMWLVKLNVDGDFQWQKCLGGSNWESASYTEETSDGGYIIAGSSKSEDGDVSGNYGNPDLWIVKLGPDVLLPISLLDFSGEAQGKQNLLHWTTTNEINNTGFEIQRSMDGRNFKPLDFVNSRAVGGNSSQTLSYTYTDIGYYATTNYYRLKQIDKDGKFSYSNIVVLRNNHTTPGIFSVYPNPVKDIVNVRIVSAGATTITMHVTDVNGKKLFNKIVPVGIGESIVQLNISTLTPGIYFLKIFSADGKEYDVKKIVRQ